MESFEQNVDFQVKLYIDSFEHVRVNTKSKSVYNIPRSNLALKINQINQSL